VAKRFTDTDKFIDPWYRRLSTKNKLLWDWLLCNCDHAGIITVDFEFIEMVLAEKFEDDVLGKYFSERVFLIGPCKYFIPKFLKFQYGKLNPGSRIHASVIALLRDAGVIYNDGDSVKEIENNARVIGFANPIHRVKDKDKDKDQAQDKEQDKVKEKEKVTEPKKNLPKEEPLIFRNSKGPLEFTPEHFRDLWNEIFYGTLGACRGIGFGIHLEKFLLTTGFLSTEQHWRELFSQCLTSPYLMGKTEKKFKLTPSWVVDYDNIIKIQEGRYHDNENAGSDDDIYAKIKEQA
jgi:hypothetical protein